MKFSSLKKRIGFESWYTIQTFLSRILSFGIGLLFKILLARELTVEDNGVFGKWLAAFNYGLIAFSFGLNLSMIYYDKKKESILNNFIGNVVIYFFLLIIGLCAVFFIPKKIYYLTLCIAIFFGLLTSSLNSIQLSTSNVTIFNVTEITRNILILVFCLFPIFFFQFSNIDTLYILYTLALAATFIIFVFFINYKDFNFKRIKIHNIEYIKFGFKGTVLNVLSQSVYIVDIFIVSYIAGPYYLGLYVVASSIARLLWFFVDAAGTVIFPRLVHSTDQKDSRNIIYKISTFSFITSIIGLIFFLLLGNQLIALTFGIEYTEGFYTIIILMFASPGMIFFKLINRYLASQNQWNKSYLAIGISLIVNVILNFYLIEKYNIIGAAIASFISYWLCGFIISKLARFNFLKLMFTRNLIK